MVIRIIERDFSVCKVADYSKIKLTEDYVFTGKSDEECSLVCPSECVPDNAVECDDGWKAFRIEGILDFSLIGILAGISSLLADNKIGIFAVSTYNTDYIFTKSADFKRAVGLLENSGFTVANKLTN